MSKIQVPIESDKNSRYLTSKPITVFDRISLISSENEKCFRQKL